MNANSVRFRKTDEAIREAFWVLLREKGFDQLRATDIIKTAGINRSTFYEHYLDKYDLAERLEDELLNGLAEITDSAFSMLREGETAGGDDGAASCRSMAVWLAANGERFVLLMRSEGNPAFSKKLWIRLHAFWDNRACAVCDPMRNRYTRAAILGFLTGLLNEWADSGTEHPPEQLHEVLMEALAPLHHYIKRQSPPRDRQETARKRRGEHEAAAEALPFSAAGRPGTEGAPLLWEENFEMERRDVCDDGK